MVVVAAGTTLTFANSFAANVLICSAVVFYMKVLKVVCTCMCVSVGKLYEEIICEGTFYHTLVHISREKNPLVVFNYSGSLLLNFLNLIVIVCKCGVSSTYSYDQNLL